MKLNIQKVIRACTSFIACSMLILCMVFPASAAIFDPYENGTVTVDGDFELVTVRLDTSKMFWQRFHDGNASLNATGSTFSYSTQMRYVDNDDIHCYPFGLLNRVETGGIPIGSRITYDFTVGINISNASQTFDVIAYMYLDTYNDYGSVIATTTLESDFANGITDGAFFVFDQFFDTSLLAGSASWQLRFQFEMNGVANENDTTSVTLTSFGDNISVVIPYSQLYQLQQQGEKTNKLLQTIDAKMAENGQKLEQIMNGSQADQNAAQDFENNASNQSQQIGNANNAMNNVNKPPVNNVNTNVNTIVDVGNAGNLAPFLVTIMGSPHIIAMFTIMLTVSLAAYILFGKR